MSRQGKYFIAEVSELYRCAAGGAPYKEVLAQAEIVIAEWIETARSLKPTIPEPKGKLMYA